MAHFHKNFAYSTIATAPSPATSGTEIVVQLGQGGLFPTPPFSATIWPTGVQPISTNAEIILVTSVISDTFTIQRQQQGTSARSIIVGDQIAATITALTLNNAEETVSTWSPFILSSTGQGLQTLASATGQSATGSMLVFPVTVPANMQFNQVIIANSLTWVTSNNTVSNTYISKYGIYSMNANTLSLISSSSFSIGETLRSVSATWNYPTTTHTSGYGYGNFPAGNLTATAQYGSYVGGTRGVGLQFGGNMSLTGGMYWLGLLSLRSTGSVSTFGLSHAGIIGNIIHNVNQVGSNAGMFQIGVAGTQWTNLNSHISGWWGKHVIGFVTATSITNQAGTAIPSAITLSALGGIAAASTATILPSVTFVST